MNQKDDVFESIKNKVSEKTKVNALEVDKIIDDTFRGLQMFMEQRVQRVKIPYLGKFGLKKNLKDGSNNGLNSIGEPNTEVQS